ncbi:MULTISPECIES: ABC transporter ATP-binding protein [unclassified Brenneria]|uniref:ABC transporter ATP-binding protein n=1 Tax=unclassified Brenneria TaxID=2634434 RepID=UPI0029C4AA83|nr:MULTISPECIES: ABC transporter ATP-binding protein [unclassified Brenneria]MDX5630397.1 ABC transporter ATP-binding protein [Brenneria sp. L3-3Z]MDX5697542.1 ABC transporter ATP-binding protein [Brenneria sp. L4-2C]
MALSDSLLDVDNLSIGTESGSSLATDLCFSVARREIVALVGESGSGKTLTSLALMGLLPSGVHQTGGEIRFEGQTIARPGSPFASHLRGQRMATIFQEPMTSMNPVLKVGEQIAEVLVRHQKLSWKQAQSEAVALLDRVGIVNPALRARQYIHQLSGGMRQRVMIASAISCKPSLLIADEPTTALDATIQTQILALLQTLQREMAMGILLITHDLSVVARYADRACVMYRGRIVEQGEVPTLLTQPQNDYTRKLIAASQPQPRATRAPDGQAAPLVSIECLTKSYPQKNRLPFFPAQRHTVLFPTSMNIGRAEIVGLIGESGSGKTTLGRAAIGLIPVDSGKITFDGDEVSSQGRQRLLRRRAQIIFQDPYASLNPKMTIGEQIAEPVRVYKLRPADQIQARVDALLALVGLEPHHARRLPAAFSGGQRQRIAIARALALEPDLLVADEAVSALDLSVRGQILALLDRLREQLGLSVLFISHDLSAVRQLCDRVVVLYRGKIVESGVTEQILNAPRHAYTRQLLDAAPDIGRALRLRQAS